VKRSSREQCMTESTHDLIAAKAARLRELLHLASEPDSGPTMGLSAHREDVGYGLTRGSGWTN